mgnify:CR=1 FL=1
MDPMLALMAASLGTQGIGAITASQQAKKRAEELDEEQKKLERERDGTGINEAQQAMQEAQILSPLANRGRQLQDQNDSLLGIAEMNSGADLLESRRDTASEILKTETDARRLLNMDALNRAQQRRRELDAEIAALRAGRLGYQTDSQNAMLGLMQGVGADLAMLAAPPPETTTNLLAGMTPEQQAMYARVDNEIRKNPQRIIDFLDGLEEDV